MVWTKPLYSVLILNVVNDGNHDEVYCGEIYTFLSPK